MIPFTDIRIRRANYGDSLYLAHAFRQMLSELKPLGHDAAPTEKNAVMYWNHVFGPAMQAGHDCFYIAYAETTPVGALFWNMNSPFLDWNESSAIDHGCWVHP